MDVSKMVSGPDDGKWYIMPGTEFEGKEKAVKIKVRQPKPKKIREIRDSCKRRKFGGRRNEEELDESAVNVLLLDECVLDWKNIEQDGKPLPCTLANKQMLDDNWQAFSQFWNNIFMDGQNADDLIVEEQEKN